MKPWQLTYLNEQTAMAINDHGGISSKRALKGCGELAPESGLKICLRPFQGATTFCQRLLGHPGCHSSKPERCNRPAGHEGPHTFIVARDARRLGEW